MLTTIIRSMTAFICLTLMSFGQAVDSLHEIPRMTIPSGPDWVIDSYRYTFNNDGTCLANNEIHGKWRIHDNKFIATWENGFVDTYDLPGSRDSFHGINQEGRKLILRKDKAR